MSHIPYIGDFYRICGDIMNKYHPTIEMAGMDEQFAIRFIEKSNQANNLQIRVENDHMRRRNSQWNRLDDNHVPEFPHFTMEWNRLNENHVPEFPYLTMEYLRDLTVGIYQLKLAPLYI
ncbi:hypothetical protein JTB14_012655 [Gonioctena quinquepunctata]|nr:hypothetical protein JTB14_012655 [Gonioctena quinquepunctata]